MSLWRWEDESDSTAEGGGNEEVRTEQTIPVQLVAARCKDVSSSRCLAASQQVARVDPQQRQRLAASKLASQKPVRRGGGARIAFRAPLATSEGASGADVLWETLNLIDLSWFCSHGATAPAMAKIILHSEPCR